MSKKISLFVTCFVWVIMLCCGLSLSTPVCTELKPQVFAADSGDLVISVNKVNVDNVNATSKNDFLNIATSNPTAVTNDGLVELNTANNEAIEIKTVNASGKTIIIQSVDLKLNGYTLLHNWQTSDSYNYSQYLFGLRASELDSKFCYDVTTGDLPTTQTGYATTQCTYTTTTTTQNGKTLTIYTPGNMANMELVEGCYQITVNYSAISSSVSQTATFKFYMFRTDTYTPAYENPTFDNTEKFEFNSTYTAPTDVTQRAPKLNYFNFNNNNTTAWNGTTFATNTNSTDKLYYPTISYNPEKFNLSYVYTLYGYQEVVRTSFNNGILTVTNTITDVSSSVKTTTLSIPQNANGTYTVSIVFDEVGEYVISKTAFLTYIENGSTTTSQKAIDETINASPNTSELLRSEKLIINGYVPQYAINQNENATMYSSNYYNELNGLGTTIDNVYAKLFKTANSYLIDKNSNGNEVISADFTFATTKTITSNENNVGENLITYDGNNYQIANSNTQVASTNLPPVSFKYYGRINTSASWIAFKGNNSSEFEFLTYTANKNFKDAGEYYVLLSYTNLLNSQPQDVYSISNSNEYTWQLFHFKITNEQAKLSLMQDLGNGESQQLNRQFVNTPVFVQWISPGPFDSKVRAEYSVNNGTTWTEITTQSKILYENNALYEFSPFTQNGNYEIRIYKLKNNNNDSNYSINYKFSIDQEPISGIKAIKVDNNKLSTQTLSSQENFNLIVSDDFAWTWNEKANGNTITAKYVYASIVDNPTNSFTITDYEGKKLVSSNYIVNEFTAPITYTLPQPNVTLSPLNQLITNSQIAVLMLSDMAGNTASFITILDKTKTEILTPIYADYDDNPSTPDTFNNEYSPINSALNVKSDTEFFWGTHKSINITDTTSNSQETEIYTNLKNIGSILDGWTLSGKSYEFTDNIKVALNEHIESNLLLPINSITLSVNEDSISPITLMPTKGTKTETTPITYSEPLNWKAKLKITTNATRGLITGAIYVDDSTTPQLEVQKTNEENATNRLTYTFNIPPQTFTATVNMDNSNSRVTINGNEIELAPNGITNANMIQFEFTNSPNFSVESVTLKYYAFDFSNKNSANYPFSETYSTKTLWQSTNEVVVPTTITIPYILKISTGTGNPLSREGKYVITRKYKTNDNLGSDVENLTLTYYVDRREIIPVNTNNYGSDIYLKFNNDDNILFNNLHTNSTSVWNESLLNLDNSTPLVTTDYDVTLCLGNLYKYGVNTNYNKLYTIIVGPNGTSFVTSTTTYQRNNPGKYKVIIFDSADLKQIIDTSNNSLDYIKSVLNSLSFNSGKPNFTTFTFEITQTPDVIPSVLVGNEWDEYYPMLSLQNLSKIEKKDDNIYRTNKNIIALRWDNPQSIYMSRIIEIDDIPIDSSNYRKLNNITQEANNIVHIRYSNGKTTTITIYVSKKQPLDTVQALINNDPMITIVKEIKGQNASNYETFFANTLNNSNNSTLTNFLNNYVFSVTLEQLENYLIEQNQDELSLRNDFYVTTLKSNNEQQIILKDGNIIYKKDEDIANPTKVFNSGVTYQIREQTGEDNFTIFNVKIINETATINLDITYFDEETEKSIVNHLEKNGTFDSKFEFSFLQDAQTPTENSPASVNDSSTSSTDDTQPSDESPTLDDSSLDTTSDDDTTPNNDSQTEDPFSPTQEESEIILGSWIIPDWIPIKITNTITNSTRYYFYIPNTTDTNRLNLVFSQLNYNNKATTVQTIRQLINELNSFVTTESSALGAHFELVVLNENFYHTSINQAGDPIDFSQNPFFTQDNEKVYISADRLATVTTDATYAKDAKIYIFRDTNTPINPSGISVIENGRITHESINIETNDLVKIEIVDNYNRIQSFLVENATSLIALPEINYMYERNTNYPLNIITKSELKEIYNYTIDDFVVKYNPKFNLKITITDMLNNTTSITTIKNTVKDSEVIEQPHMYLYGENNAWYNPTRRNELVFKAIPNAYVLISIELQLGDITVIKNSSLNFAIYTMHPRATITNSVGTELNQNGSRPIITGKTVNVKIPNYQDETYQFSPKVKLIYKDLNATTQETLELNKNSTLSFDKEGHYSIVYENIIGVFNPSETEITFTIRKNIPDLYNVTVRSESNDENFDYLTPVDTKLKYTNSDGITKYLTQYIYQHKNSNTANTCLDRVSVTTNDDRNLSCAIQKTIENGSIKTRIYQLTGTGSNNVNVMFAVTCIVSQYDTLNHEQELYLTDSTRLYEDTTQEKINTSSTTIFIHYPEEEGGQIEPVWAELNWKTDLIRETGYDKLEFDNFYKLEIYEGEYTGNSPNRIDVSGKLKLTQTGIYTIRLVDLLGRYLKFDNQDYFVITLLNDVPFYVKTIEDESANTTPIPYQTFNDEVTMYVPNTYGNVNMHVKRNNIDFDVSESGGMYAFDLPGTYTVVLTANVSSTYGSSAAPLQSTYNFSILSKEIALKSYNFAPISGHKIVSVDKKINNEWQTVEGLDNLYTLYIDTTSEEFGEGEYRLNVMYTGTYANQQNYSFAFWISNSEPNLTCSRAWGSTSTSPFEISFNPSLIYKSVGDCRIVITSEKTSQSYTIDKSSIDITDSQSMKFQAVGVYVIQIISADGTVLNTYRMTIKTPLNAAAIIIIILGACGLAFGIFAFFKLRRKMKVR